MFIIMWRKPIVLYLTAVVPVRWGDRDKALKFLDRGTAQRVAIQLRLTGPWSIEPA